MPIAISLSPNTQKDDVILALRLLLKPRVWIKGKETIKLENDFKKYLGCPFAFSFDSGRSSLLAILKCLGIGPGDEVLLQAFTCVAVVNPILWVGAKPVFVDIEKDGFNMDPVDLKKKITKRSKVLIIQHTFGQPARLQQILKIARNRRLLVVEDCAQALGAEYQGRKVGTFGIAAIFSFGRDKVISSVFGGMAVTSDSQLGEKLEDFQKNLKFPSKFWVFQQLLHPLAFSLILPVYNFFNLGKVILVGLQKLHLLSFPVTWEEKRGKKPKSLPLRLPNALAVLTQNQLKKVEEMNKHRKKIAQFYQRELQGLDLKLPREEKGSKSIFLRFCVKTKNAQSLYGFAKKKKILLGRWYSQIIDPRGTDLQRIGYKMGSCPQAEKTAKVCLNLPTYPRLTFPEAQRVISLIWGFPSKK